MAAKPLACFWRETKDPEGVKQDSPGREPWVQGPGAHPSIPYRDSITDYDAGELTALIRWINSDGQLRTDDELVDEMVRELGFARRGARIEAAVREAIQELRHRNLL